jgi:pyridinium-3,5-biscarboxylic acid mononucleotide synthase
MEPWRIKHLLEAVQGGSLSVDEAVQSLKDLPFENLGYAQIDHHRALRRGFPEVVLGGAKTTDQIHGILQALLAQGSTVLVTRLPADQALELQQRCQPIALQYHALARCLWYEPTQPRVLRGRGPIAVVCAGTSDIPVAEEAALTAELMGNVVDRLWDVGVSGLHRLLAHRDRLERAEVLIVVAGMEGALPSVVGGLVARPVIAVPTSVGYGAHFGGLTPLLSMLNSCSSGVTVVNIDNGFGAGFAAALMNRSPDTVRTDGER